MAVINDPGLTAVPNDVTTSAPVTIDFEVTIGNGEYVALIEGAQPFPWNLVFWWDFPDSWVIEPGIFPALSDPTLGPHTTYLTTEADWGTFGDGSLINLLPINHRYTPPPHTGDVITPNVWISYFYHASDIEVDDGIHPGSAAEFSEFFSITQANGIPPPLRLGQRNDGLGPTGHARLNNTSSTQIPSAPRVGGKNIYSRSDRGRLCA